jgi:tetratricopeptide (TPR) repeat protein
LGFAAIAINTVRAILILALASASLAGQESLVERGYSHFYNLEYPEALADFQQAAALNPADPELHNHLAQTILVQEMYRNGALESELVSGTNSFVRRPNLNPAPEMEKRFLDELSKAMALSEERLQKNPRDTEAMYALGISYGLRTNYFWVVKKSWRDSLRDANAARALA